MNKILERLGLYDLTVVLLTGMIISTFTAIISEYIFGCPEVGKVLQTNETVRFLVVSYFVGLVFQEIGSVIQKYLIHRNNGVLKRALRTSDNLHYLLSQIEKDKILGFVKNQLKLEQTQGQEAIIYNYCKSKMLENGDVSQADRNQYISSMSRSLSVYFGFISMIMLVKTICEFQFFSLSVTVIAILLSLILYQRSVRFAVIRYVYVFRAFCHQIISEG